MTTLSLRELVVAARVPPLSATVAAGELVGVVAPAALGTAIARVVAGLAAPVSGRVEVADRDVTDLPPARRQVGYVPAGGALLPHLTVGQNIEYGLRHRETVHEVTRSWVAGLLDRLELGATLHLRPHLLSESQRLRAALARVAACLPEALVVDLPTATGGGDRLGDLVSRAGPRDAAGMAVLVCSADAAVLAETHRRVPA
jgi:ABC-type Fe3+/spermidine/putrescine transport system ATPase subunit